MSYSLIHPSPIDYVAIGSIIIDEIVDPQGRSRMGVLGGGSVWGCIGHVCPEPGGGGPGGVGGIEPGFSKTETGGEIKNTRNVVECFLWALQDSNLRPTGYEPVALTAELRALTTKRATGFEPV